MKRFLKLSIFLILLLITSCTATPPSKTYPLVPTNLKIEETTLMWDQAPDVKYYEIYIKIYFSDDTTQNDIIEVSTTLFNFDEYISEELLKIEFKVSALAKETTYTNPSQFSDIVTYEHINDDPIITPVIPPVVYDKDILNQSFLGQNTAPEGWTYNYSASIYADKTLKFSSSKQSITSASFTSYANFKVEATIIGKNAGGDATITFYGLNSEGKTVEKVEVVGSISNTKNVIEATFTNTSITQIKFEYTTKATGNFGLYSIYIYHLDSEELLSIKAKNCTTTYTIGEQFDYNGSLILTYPNNVTKEILLSEIKKDVTISNFINDKFYKGSLMITYQNKSTTVNYVTTYSYPSLIDSTDDISFTVLNNLVLLEISEMDIVINLGQAALDTYVNNYINDGIIEYYYGNNLASHYTFVNILDENDDVTYHLTPTTKMIYTTDGILIESFGTCVLINTTNQIDSDIQNNYDYIISNTAINLASTNNFIINKNTLVSDYDVLSNIYMSDSSTAIYDTTIDEVISLNIDKYGSSFTTTVTEISSTSSWDYLYKYEAVTYIYNHEEYYEVIKNLSGSALKNSLQTLITTTHTTLASYDLARTAYAKTDADLDTPGNIILFYSKSSISSVWDNGITWNREHVWPKSLSGGLFTSVSGSDKNAGTDLHHIRPASSSINSSRKNKPYGPTTNATYFAPNDDVKGDVARILFYMSIRYNMDIEKLGVAQSVEMLIEWHNLDPVDYYEEYRNEQVQLIQGNYNPFIDNPWLVDFIF